MSRSVAIAVVCALGFGLVACGKDDSPSDNSAAGTSGVAGANGAMGGANATGGSSGVTGNESGTTGGATMTMTGGGAGGATGGTSAGNGGAGAGGADGGAGTGGAGDPAVWAMMGYDQNNNYHNPFETKLTVENAPMLTEKWVFTVGGYPPGSPVVAEGKVFVMATGGTYAIDLQEGTMVWAKTNITGTATLAYADGAIYAHTTPGANLYKLDAATGEVLWGPVQTYAQSGADGTSSPIVAGGKVFVGHCTGNEIFVAEPIQSSSHGGVEAFDAETGDSIWSYKTTEGMENGAMVWSTVSVDLDASMVFATTGNNYRVAGPNSDAFHAINIADGTREWVQQVRAGDVWVLGLAGGSQDTDFGANPILANIGDRKVVAAGDKGSAFWVLDRVTGEIIWNREDLSSSHTPANGGMLNNGAFDGDRFYVASNQPPGASVLHAMNAADGMDAWPAKTLNKIVWGTLTVANGVLTVPVGTELHLYNAATGDMLNMFETGGTIAAGGASIVDGMVIVKSGLSYPLDASALPNNQIHAYGLPD